MPISHTRPIGIYHWDTFDNETDLVEEADTLEEAEAKIRERYGDRISPRGADRVDVVDLLGRVVLSFRVTWGDGPYTARQPRHFFTLEPWRFSGRMWLAVGAGEFARGRGGTGAAR